MAGRTFAVQSRNVVFENDRDPMKGATSSFDGSFPIELCGLSERARVRLDDRTESRTLQVHLLDARKVCLGRSGQFNRQSFLSQTHLDEVDACEVSGVEPGA